MTNDFVTILCIKHFTDILAVGNSSQKLQKMASKGFHAVTDSSPSSPCRSYQSMSGTDSPTFYSPRSLSPDIVPVQGGEEISRDDAPLITHENDEGELSMSIVFPDSSSSSVEAEVVPFWKHMRHMPKKIKPWFFFLLAIAFSALFAIHEEVPETARLLCVSRYIPEYFELKSNAKDSVVTVQVSGPFIAEDDASDSQRDQNLTIALVSKDGNSTRMMSEYNTYDVVICRKHFISNCDFNEVQCGASFNN